MAIREAATSSFIHNKIKGKFPLDYVYVTFSKRTENLTNFSSSHLHFSFFIFLFSSFPADSVDLMADDKDVEEGDDGEEDESQYG